MRCILVLEGQAADIGEWPWQLPRLTNKPMIRNKVICSTFIQICMTLIIIIKYCQFSFHILLYNIVTNNFLKH